MATAVKFKKLSDEEEGLTNEDDRDQDGGRIDGSIQEVVNRKKCKNPFNSVAAVVIGIGVFLLTVLVSLVIVLIVNEPPPPFYPGRLQEGCVI